MAADVATHTSRPGASTGSLGPGSTRGTCPPALSLLRPQGITSFTKLCTKHVRSSLQGPSVFGMSGTPNASWKKSRGTPFLNLVAAHDAGHHSRGESPLSLLVVGNIALALAASLWKVLVLFALEQYRR